MDEKESLPDKPNKEESQGSGDNTVAEKPDEQAGAFEDVKEASDSVDGGIEASADSAEEAATSSEVKNDSDVVKSETDQGNEEVNELQNHIDHDVSAEDSNSVKSDVAKEDDSKKDLVDTTDAESQEDIKEEGMCTPFFTDN